MPTPRPVNPVEEQSALTGARLRDYLWFAALLLMMIALKAVQLRS